jgi:hypothetical protein
MTVVDTNCTDYCISTYYLKFCGGFFGFVLSKNLRGDNLRRYELVFGLNVSN